MTLERDRLTEKAVLVEALEKDSVVDEKKRGEVGPADWKPGTAWTGKGTPAAGERVAVIRGESVVPAVYVYDAGKGAHVVSFYDGFKTVYALADLGTRE